MACTRSEWPVEVYIDGTHDECLLHGKMTLTTPFLRKRFLRQQGGKRSDTIVHLYLKDLHCFREMGGLESLLQQIKVDEGSVVPVDLMQYIPAESMPTQFKVGDTVFATTTIQRGRRTMTPVIQAPVPAAAAAATAAAVQAAEGKNVEASSAAKLVETVTESDDEVLISSNDLEDGHLKLRKPVENAYAQLRMQSEGIELDTDMPDVPEAAFLANARKKSGATSEKPRVFDTMSDRMYNSVLAAAEKHAKVEQLAMATGQMSIIDDFSKVEHWNVEGGELEEALDEEAAPKQVVASAVQQESIESLEDNAPESFDAPESFEDEEEPQPEQPAEKPRPRKISVRSWRKKNMRRKSLDSFLPLKKSYTKKHHREEDSVDDDRVTPKQKKRKARSEAKKPEKDTTESEFEPTDVSEDDADSEDDEENVKKPAANEIGMKPSSAAFSDAAYDEDNLCASCKTTGRLVFCDGGKHHEGCGLGFHLSCIKRFQVPAGDWICTPCAHSLDINVGMEGHEFKDTTTGLQFRHCVTKKNEFGPEKQAKKGKIRPAGARPTTTRQQIDNKVREKMQGYRRMMEQTQRMSTSLARSDAFDPHNRDPEYLEARALENDRPWVIHFGGCFTEQATNGDGQNGDGDRLSVPRLHFWVPSEQAQMKIEEVLTSGSFEVVTHNDFGTMYSTFVSGAKRNKDGEEEVSEEEEPKE